MRKIVEGGTDKSYGIYVAQMAGLPNAIIKKAKIYLELLTKNEKKISFDYKKEIDSIISGIDVDKNDISEDLINNLKQIDINNISPLEALNLLNYIIKKYVK